MALFDSAIGGCYCCVSFSPRVRWIGCFFLFFFACGKRQIRKSKKQNQTFPVCPFCCHALSGNCKQYWCRLVLVRKRSSTQKCWLLVLTSFSCRGRFHSATSPVSSIVCVVELIVAEGGGICSVGLW